MPERTQQEREGALRRDRQANRGGCKEVQEGMQNPLTGCVSCLLGMHCCTDTLCIGSGESGKSTIVKQMKIIHQNGYTRDELLVFRLVVYDNLIESAQAIVKQMRKMGIDPEIPENRVRTYHTASTRTR
jgi:G-protein alpha subunit